MKRILEISSVAVISFLLVIGCTNKAVKSGQPATTHSPEKKTVETQPDVQPEQKKAESQGVIGGQGAQKAEGQPASKSKYQARKERLAKFKADYEKSTDKLDFLLANLDSPDDRILVEVAALLRHFDEPESIEALKQLSKHRAREDAPWSVTQSAKSSLRWHEVAPAMQELHPDMPANMIENLIVKYRNNREARGHIYTMMKQELGNNPEKYVPLIIEYYAYLPQTAELAKQYPDIADKGLEKCLAGTSAHNVGYCMVLIGKTENNKFLDNISDIAFFDKGNIDYGDSIESFRVRDQALMAYYYVQAISLPYLEKVLYSQYDEDKLKVVSTMVATRELLGEKNVLSVLVKYYNFISKQEQRNQIVFDAVFKTMTWLEQEIK